MWDNAGMAVLDMMEAHGYMLVSISKTDGPSGGMAAIFRKPA